MLRRAGQAGARALGGPALLLHWMLEAVLLLAVLGVLGAGVLAWRLAQGPVEIGWLARRLEAAANAEGGPTRVEVGGAALVWQGFQHGVDRPLELRVTGLRAVNGTGQVLAAIPQADVSLSARWLLFGRLVLRAVELRGPSLRLLRAADGAMRVDLGSLAEGAEAAATPAAAPAADYGADLAPVLRMLRRPAQDDAAAPIGGPGLLDQLAVVKVDDARLSMVDQQFHVVWLAPLAHIELRRRAAGGVAAAADITLALGDTSAQLVADGVLDPDSGNVSVQASLTPLRPAALARAAPGLAPLAALDAPLQLTGAVRLDRDFRPRDWRLGAHIGAGSLHVGTGAAPVSSADIAVHGDSAGLDVTQLDVHLPGNTLPVRLSGTAALRRQDDAWDARIALDVDQLAFADLPLLWPTGTGRFARGWIVDNITAGVARNAHAEMELTAPLADPQALDIRALAGSAAGSDLTINWLRPVPPVEHAQALLTIEGPDAIRIDTTGGKQGPIGLREGRIRISGLATTTQVADISVRSSGALPDALALLRHKRLGLLERRPLPITSVSGSFDATLSVHLPLEDKVTMDQIGITAEATLSDVGLPGAVAGRDLTAGALKLTVDNNGLKLGGTAQVAAIPASVGLAMDFTQGGPSQVMQRATLEMRPSAAQLAAAGLDAEALVQGQATLSTSYLSRRNGSGALEVNGDLGDAVLTLAPLGWSKPAGSAARLGLRLVLEHDRITRLDDLRLDGPDIEIAGRGDFAGERMTALHLSRVRLGQTQGSAEIRWPAQAGAPWRFNLSGPELDLSGTLKPKPHDGGKPVEDQNPGPPWAVEARFDRVRLAHDSTLGPLNASLASDGRLVRTAHMSSLGPEQAHFDITDTRGVRQVSASAGDAGLLLRALGVVERMDGGTLALAARYDDTRSDHPLVGTATIGNFRVRNAPVMAQLLKAMTLYGVVELLQGPGLSISQLVAPFRYTGDRLELENARAFTPSLGITARGRIDLASDDADLQGTVVPAYVFNQLLGNLPILGKLFSPEAGGGVFAATYTIRGKLADPRVVVNPLAALTPGFLRGLFGILDRK